MWLTGGEIIACESARARSRQTRTNNGRAGHTHVRALGARSAPNELVYVHARLRTFRVNESASRLVRTNKRAECIHIHNDVVLMMGMMVVVMIVDDDDATVQQPAGTSLNVLLMFKLQDDNDNEVSTQLFRNSNCNWILITTKNVFLISHSSRSHLISPAPRHEHRDAGPRLPHRLSRVLVRLPACLPIEAARARAHTQLCNKITAFSLATAPNLQ